MMRSPLFLPTVALAVLNACGPAHLGNEIYSLEDLVVERIEPADWLLGTRVTIIGSGFIPAATGSMRATIDGNASGVRILVSVNLAVESKNKAFFVITPDILATLPVDGPTIEGNLKVERLGPSGVRASATITFSARAVSRLSPVITKLEPLNVYPGEELELSGEGFLLPGEALLAEDMKAHEGHTSLRFSGFLISENRTAITVTAPVQTTARNSAVLMLTPDLFGIAPFVFEGRVQAVNIFGEAAQAVEIASNQMPIRLEMNPTRLDALTPLLVRRGQQLTFLGKGFLPPKNELGTYTFFTFVGLESYAHHITQYGETNPLVFLPDAVDDNSAARLIIRTLVGADGEVSGFGSKRASLKGTFTPYIVFRDKVFAGKALSTTLEVGRQVQVVYLRFLPTFYDALAIYGLGDLAEFIEERIFEVCSSDYKDFSVDFRRTRPKDFAHFLTVEIMGKDPNDAGLFGLDNSFGKDVGNLTLDEVIGGYNAQSEAAGYYPYGGIFVESFKYFSPKFATPKTSFMASETFDLIFGHVMPALGGRPATRQEYESSGPRGDAVREAVRVMGNLVADTITHEVGHALGLAAVAGDFHDPGDNPGFIMDAGVFRPFEERAQMPGAAPRVFAPYDYEYLQEILPLD